MLGLIKGGVGSVKKIRPGPLSLALDVLPHGLIFRPISTDEGIEKINVHYGSQSGTAYGFAQELADAVEELGVESSVDSLANFADYDLKDSVNVFVASCYGRGEPTDNAKEFYDWLMSEERTKADLEGSRYAVFGLGSSRTHGSFYNVIGRAIDARMESLGGVKVHTRGEGDDSGSIESDFTVWKDSFVEKLKTITSEKTETKEESSKVPAKPFTVKVVEEGKQGEAFVPREGLDCLTRRRVYPQVDAKRLNLSWVERLNEGSLAPDAFEVGLRTPDGDPVEYTTGDHVSLYPSNEVDVVAAVAKRLRLDLNTVVEIEDGTASAPITGRWRIGDILLRHVDLSGPPTGRLLKALAKTAHNPTDRATLLEWATPQVFTSRVLNMALTLPRLLERFPSASPTIETLIDAAPAICPRTYSISSPASAGKHGTLRFGYREVSVPSPQDGGERPGLCTGWLTRVLEEHRERMARDSAALLVSDAVPVLATIRHADFTLPEDPMTPVIMIGGGIGITPFVAFLQERI